MAEGKIGDSWKWSLNVEKETLMNNCFFRLDLSGYGFHFAILGCHLDICWAIESTWASLRFEPLFFHTRYSFFVRDIKYSIFGDS